MIETRTLPADTDLLALHRQDPQRYPVLLESVASGTAQGRWDLLLCSDGSGLRLGVDGTTRDLAGKVGTAPAGAGIVGALVFVFVVLLVTDILGLTKVFPFTRSVR